MIHRHTVLLFTLAAAILFAGTASAAKFNKKVDLGQKAPAWSGLEGIDGKRHGLNDYADAKVLVIAFSCNLCPVSQSYEERFIELVRRYKSAGVAFVAINVNSGEGESLDRMKQHAAKAGFNFDYLRDAGQQTARDYGATCTPHLFVLDKDRRIAYMGAFDDKWYERSKVSHEYVKDAVDALLKGEQPEIRESLQTGCSIEYDFAEASPAPPASAEAVGDEPASSEIKLTIATPDDFDKQVMARRGKVVLVDFWATWCLECRKEFPRTVAYSRKYAKDGLVVISMSMDEPDDDSQKQALTFLQKQKAAFTNLLSALGGGEEGMTAFDIDGGALPHYTIYDREGKIFKTFSTGDFDNVFAPEDVEKALREALGLADKP